MRSKKKPAWRGLILLPLLAALAALGTYLLLPPKPPDAGIKPGGEEEKLRPIGVPQAAEFHKSGLVFVDIRDPESYARARISKAKPFGNPEDQAGLAVVVYGQGDDMEKVLTAAESLIQAGSAPVYVLLEGFAGWLEAGLPVEKEG